MTYSAFGPSAPSLQDGSEAKVARELPVGSGLLIALSAGIVSWWAILKTVLWIAG